MNKRLIIILIGTIGITALIWFLAGRFPGALDSDHEQASLVRAVGIMVLLAVGLIATPRLNLKGTMKYAVIWLLIANCACDTAREPARIRGSNCFCTRLIRAPMNSTARSSQGEMPTSTPR